ncbi:NADP-dependent oxidoreductase [Actinomadura sp. 6N118]|uniref:NADP-dependent oxidoreductase n=1 Tax=Actinomadura sp. 6N118 TaxID=3375151 RepID=UPI003788C7F8
MRAVRVEKFGVPEVMQVVEVPDAVAGVGEVLVRAIASSVNPVDVKTCEGAIGEGMPPLPMTLGWDLAGIVVDAGTSEFPVGAPVIAMSHQLDTGRGTWADLVPVPVGSLALAPATSSLTEAGTLPLSGLTALQTLDWLEVTAGDRVLLTGAAGAVGSLALQIAVARGARVDALVSRAAGVDVAREHGAGLVTTDRSALPARAYDAVFDTFGAFVTDTVADGGRYASIATQAGPVPDLTARGVRTILNQVQEDGTALAELARLVDKGVLHIRMDSFFGLHQISEAVEHFARGGLKGRIAVSF